jgi:two-component system invasion response regulator UvrY
MKKTTVMLIDDHTLIRETWRALLNTVKNIEIVAESGDGHLALDLARTTRPDIVLLDINMSPIGGMEVLKMIRKLSPVSRVIAVSMHSQPVYAKKMLRLGAKGYVTKNSPLNELLDAIKEVSIGNIFVCEEVKKISPGQITDDEHSVPDINSLSGRELQIASLITAGGSSKEMAAELGISLKTIEVHRYNILKKLNLKNTISLIRYINANAVDL